MSADDDGSYHPEGAPVLQPGRSSGMFRYLFRNAVEVAAARGVANQNASMMGSHDLWLGAKAETEMLSLCARETSPR